MLSQLQYITSLDLLRDIIQQEMSLPDSQIYIYAQPNIIPSDNNLYVVIEYKYSKVYSNRNLNPSTTLSVLSQEQNINTQEFLTVQLFSRSFEALRRKEEAVMALKSYYSQTIQEQYSFKLSTNAQILDLTSLEASAMLYRYDIPVVVLSAYQKIKTVAWYESYTVAVDVNTDSQDIIVDFTQPTVSLPT